MNDDEKNLSVMVAAVSGSSRLFDKLTGAEALYAVDRCQKRMIRGIDGFRGRIVRTTNDEIIAAFEHPDDACQAAMAMQRRIADLPPVAGIKLAVRAGVHHGPVIDDQDDLTGHCVGVAEALSGLAIAGQVLIGGEARELLSPALKSATHGLDKVWLQSISAEQSVYELIWSESRHAALSSASEAATQKTKQPQLLVRYGQQSAVLDQNKSTVIIGRDQTCDITVLDRRVSRQHARIDRVSGYFVLSDLSTNGTFVTLKGENELLLKREEFILRGSGIIAFAGSANRTTANIVEFEHL
ncbi:MAG: adenylate/guanylate cyclase domain-containing protein [Candidatus Accumulibacter sp.]|nr:adenylate/guanylate cyclase domain-containing protein [Accumulibacter sp.]